MEKKKIFISTGFSNSPFGFILKNLMETLFLRIGNEKAESFTFGYYFGNYKNFQKMEFVFFDSVFSSECRIQDGGRNEWKPTDFDQI